MKQTDEHYMRMAIRLARKGVNRVSCEPLVGVVVVADGRVVGRGYADTARNDSIAPALVQAGPAAEQSVIYINIAPWSDPAEFELSLPRLISARPSRIVVGAVRNDATRRTIESLKQMGIETTTEVCEQECRELNERYLKYVGTGLPFVTVKFAQSLDGRIATRSGDSQWISSPASLRLAHQLRREHDAIAVGIGTVLKDDPRLTVRLVSGCDPLRIVVDSSVRIPLTARVLAKESARHTLIATTERADRARVRELEGLGAEVLLIPSKDELPGVDLLELLRALGRRRVASVLVEGGAGIITSLLAARAVDRLIVAIAPKLLGRGLEAIGDLGVVRLDEAITFSTVKTRRFGPDIIFDGRL